MNRQLRFEAAYNAVAEALLTGETFTESRLRAIAIEKLGPRAAFLATDAINRCVMTADGKTFGPDIFVQDDCELYSEASFTFIPRH